MKTTKNWIDFSEVKKKALRNKQVKKIYDELGPQYELAFLLLKEREKKGITQAQLAKKMGTSQAHIARLESGNSLPSLATLYKFGEKLGLRPKITFHPIGD
jgi:ribosome-binding protein aMBF1 (putative translation factor)